MDRIRERCVSHQVLTRHSCNGPSNNLDVLGSEVESVLWVRKVHGNFQVLHDCL